MIKIIKNTCNSLARITLVLSCYLTFSSFTGLPYQQEVTYPNYVERTTYIQAYLYRSRNHLPIPDVYYQKLNISKPIVIARPIIVLPSPIETEAMKNKKLIPSWILTGMLMQESSSYYDASGKIVFVDRKRHSEKQARGPFQMLRIAFNEISRPGESYTRLDKNSEYAEELAIRYLLYLYNGSAKQNWKRTIGMYNQGPTGYRYNISDAIEYYEGVKAKSKQ